MKLMIQRSPITLGQALKLSGEVSSGFEAKMLILDGEVKVNHEVETRRGRHLYEGDSFEIFGQEYVIDVS